MTAVFEKTTINGLALGNRLVRSATWEGLGNPDGSVSEPLVEVYRELAERYDDLRNSGDPSGDRSRVVGYGAYAFY